MRYPKKQNIYGVSYTVEVKDDLIEKYSATGLFNWKEKKIQLQKGMDVETGQKTYLHECFHGVLHRLGIDVLLSSEMNELIVDSIATFCTEEKKNLISVLSNKK